MFGTNTYLHIVFQFARVHALLRFIPVCVYSPSRLQTCETTHVHKPASRHGDTIYLLKHDQTGIVSVSLNSLTIFSKN